MFSFSGVNDGYYSESYGPGFVEALKGDRMSLYSADLLRLILYSIGCGRSLLFIKNKIAQNTAIILVGLFMVSDLFFDKTMFRHKIL
jgi:hypothetical protein